MVDWKQWHQMERYLLPDPAINVMLMEVGFMQPQQPNPYLKLKKASRAKSLQLAPLVQMGKRLKRNI